MVNDKMIMTDDYLLSIIDILINYDEFNILQSSKSMNYCMT